MIYKGKKGCMLAVCGLLACLLGACGTKSGEQTALAMQEIENMNYEEALLLLGTAEVGKEDQQMIERGRGIAYLGMTQYEEAAASLEKALSYSDEKLDQLDYDINYYLATAYYKQGLLEQAAAVYTAITDLRPEEVTAYYLRGVVELELGKTEAAKQDFDAAVAVNPEDYDVRIDIFCSCVEHGQQAMGETYLQDVLAEEDRKLTDFDRGRINYYLGDYESAKTDLEKAKDAAGAQAIVLLGQTYEQLGDYNYAASVYSNYLDTKGPDAGVYNKLGLCKLRSGDYEGALAAFKSGIQMEGNADMQTLKFNEIVAYEHMGEFSQAAILMEEYLALYPDDTAAQREYGFLQSR